MIGLFNCFRKRLKAVLFFFLTELIAAENLLTALGFFLT